MVNSGAKPQNGGNGVQSTKRNITFIRVGDMVAEKSAQEEVYVGTEYDSICDYISHGKI